MKKEFNFSQVSYEYVHHESSLPFKIFFISIGFRSFHWHKDIELILVLRGEVTVITNTENRTLSEGDLCLFNPDHFHGLIQGKGNNLLLVLQVDPDISHEYHRNLRSMVFTLPSDFRKRGDDYRAVCRSLVTMMIEVLEKKKGFDYICMGELNRIVGLIIRNFPNRIVRNNSNEDIRNKTERLKEMLVFINSRHEENLSLDDMSERFGLSTYHVSHLIKKHTGYSFQENLGLIRTQHAIRLMMNSSMRLIDIALEVGFSDIRYFNKYFKKIFGMTPRQLRMVENWQGIISNDLNMAGEDMTELLKIIRKYL